MDDGAVAPKLREARELAANRSWAQLAHLRVSTSSEDLHGCPELAYLLADALRRTGRLAEARPLAAAAEHGAVTSADTRLHLRAVNLVGMIAFETGSMAEAEARFTELLDRAAGAAEDEFAARASNNLGIVANLRHQYELALTSYQRALAAYHRLGYTRGLAQTSYNLGISYRDLGFADEADKHYSQAMQHATAAASEDVLALAETERALLRARAGDGELAESIGGRALRRLEEMGDPLGAANATRVLALAAHARGAIDLAMQRLDHALATTQTHQDLLLQAEIQRDRATMLLELGDSAEARVALASAITSFEQLGATADAEAARSLLASIAPTSPQS